MAFKKIVVAGGSGRIANHAIPAIINSTDPKFDVTVLTRASNGSSLSIPGAIVVPVDYADHAALVNAVSGADAIVFLVSGQTNTAVLR
jgi:uncharacterized protein YbjT (DUF2867 family)